MSKFSAEQEDSSPAKHMVLRLVLTVIAAVAVVVLDALTPLGLAVWLFQVVLVWIATFWANRRQILAVAAMCSTFIVVGFWLSPKTGHMMWVDPYNVLFGIGTVWGLTYSCLRQRAAEDASRKAAQELKQAQDTVSVLISLLPICAWCKKIRNEAGTWEPLELYVREHLQVELTHGICQDCAGRFNP